MTGIEENIFQKYVCTVIAKLTQAFLTRTDENSCKSELGKFFKKIDLFWFSDKTLKFAKIHNFIQV